MKIIAQNESIDLDSNNTIPNNSDEDQTQVHTIPNSQGFINTQNQLFKYSSQEPSEVLHLNRQINLNQRFLKTQRKKITKKSSSRNKLLKLLIDQDLNNLFDI